MHSHQTQLNPITIAPIRDPLEGEQAFLTYNEVTAAWDIVQLDFGDQLAIDDFSVGVTHWLDLGPLEPGDAQVRRELRQVAWEEELSAIQGEGG
ncbi:MULTISPECIES: hypothetical protein [unclassified Brevundimonas]|uniref:hypothetical protein n=1 Tax=unclassified Brevundimonas TaxID=2622653 RepID=UPI0025B8318D|nr:MULTISPECIES: hypothetical protein [unclassified Brevundimonas]